MEPDPDELVPPGQEDLRWGSGVKDKERTKGSTPSAKYNKLSEQARRLIAGESQCAMFCGGKKCKYCTADNWKPEQMAIKGLYSEWVTDNILAMARPSNYGFDNYKILEQFLENNIKTVINLQQCGEHASCGFGNDSSGFSYNPQRLMEKDIFFYNFAWQDYGIAPMSTLLDIVKVMQFSVAMGKVAVHCHAGLGRTGLLIACYLVFNNRVKAGEAVHYVRSRRPGAIQTSQQVQTVLDFETHLKPFRTIFPSKVSGDNEVSFKHFLNRQSHLIHGYEARRLKYIPKVVYVCCERLLQLAGQGQAMPKVHTNPPSSSPPATSTSQRLMLPSQSNLSMHSADGVKRPAPQRALRTSITLEDLPNPRFKKVLTEGNDDDDDDDSSNEDSNVLQDVFVQDAADNTVVASASDSNIKNAHRSEEEDDDDCIIFGKPDVLSTEVGNKCGYNRCADSETPSITLNNVYYDQSSNVNNSEGVVKKDKAGRTLVKGLSPDCESDDVSAKDSSTNCVRDPGKKHKGKRKGLGERLKNRVKNKNSGEPSSVDVDQEKGAADSDGKSSRSGPGSGAASDASSRGSADTRLSHNPVGVGVTSCSVCAAMAATEYCSEVREKADYIEAQLNETDSAWAMLAEEDNPNVLSAVFWDWLDQLKEPVLRKQDLVLILERMEGPKECLRHLEKSIKHFTEYQARVLSRLFPQTEDLETRLVERLLSHLTHQTVTLNPTFTPHQDQPSHWGEMRSNEATRLIEFFFRLIDQIAMPREHS
ncbi:protein tyrosine phosphatase domain-containing protein 1-like [Babylonia areolata]|uniref:protein tyrosine phosphatase domain-containing protein 1-like n=1 Tax=Babylonia areolata TaxID=304850 RepID=UPI003FD2DB88